MKFSEQQVEAVLFDLGGTLIMHACKRSERLAMHAGSGVTLMYTTPRPSPKNHACMINEGTSQRYFLAIKPNHKLTRKDETNEMSRYKYILP